MKLCCKDTLKTAEVTCVFGCGTVVDEDTKVCLTCREHSANAVTCETCGTRWERWDATWEEAK